MCGSAYVESRQNTGVELNPEPGKDAATADQAGIIRSSRPVARAIQRMPVRCWTMATVPATAPAASNAWSKFIRNAGSPKGSRWEAMKPRITYEG